MLEQLKAGDVSAVDAAEPVANLAIALEGAREELIGLDDDTRGALDLPVPPAELPTLLTLTQTTLPPACRRRPIWSVVYKQLSAVSAI